MEESPLLINPENNEPGESSPSKFRRIVTCLRNAPHIGLLLAILAALCYAVEKISAKDAVDHGFDSMLILALAKCINFVSTLPILCLIDRTTMIDRQEIKYILGYSASVALGTWLLFYSLNYIPVLDFTVICNTNIVFAMILSIIFLDYKISVYDIMISIIMIVGVVLMCKPTFIFRSAEHVDLKNQIIGCMMGVGSSIAIAVYNLFNRKASKTNVFVISCFSSFVMSVIYLPFAIYNNAGEFSFTVRSGIDVAVCGFIVTLGNIIHVKACHIENITTVSFGMICDVPFTFILQWVFLKTQVELFELIGIILILFGTLFILGKNSYRNDKKNNRDCTFQNIQ